jgi:hypothetical protein
MKYNPDTHHRHSIRLKGYDYLQAGAYFVTLCTQNRECLFGEITNGDVRLNDAGRMVERWWLELSKKFPTIEIDQFVIMPNHIHGMIWIQYQKVVGADLRVCPNVTQGAQTGAPLRIVDDFHRTRYNSPSLYIPSPAPCLPAGRGRFPIGLNGPGRWKEITGFKSVH